MNNKPKFHCLVADTTAFINNVPFQVCTKPITLQEITKLREYRIQ